jgi:glycosyltransferase involved in cell wall biosynthesis
MISSKKKIFFVMPQLGGGGGERVISTLLNNLDRSLFVPNLVIIKSNGSNLFLKDLKNDVDVHFLDVSVPIKFSFPVILFRLIKLVNNNKADILFFGSGQVNSLFSPFLFLFPSRCKIFARESNIPSVFEPYKLIKLFYRKFYKNYDKIIVQSDDMYNDLSINFNIPSRKLLKINNPVDVNYIRTALDAKETVIYEANKYNILVAGRLTYQKGFDLLFHELAKIKDSELNFHLTILGEGEERETLLKLVDTLELKHKVSFKGNVANPYKFMEKADLFLLSSRFEGFPNVVLESLCCGTPVLSNTCLGGILEIIKPQFNGFVFSYDENDFKSNLLKASTFKFDREEIKKDLIKRFSVNSKIKQFEKVLK